MRKNLGLNEWAVNLTVHGRMTKLDSRTLPDGAIEVFPVFVQRSAPKKVATTRSYKNEYGDRVYLHDYHFKSGRVLHEELQLDPAHSGEVFCLALRDTNGRWIEQSLWIPEQVGAVTDLPPQPFIVRYP